MASNFNLDDSTVENHWQEADQSVSNILDNMQSKEAWTLDDSPEINKALSAWIERIGVDGVEALVDEAPEDLTRVLAFVKSKRAFYFLSQAEQEIPGSTSELLLEALQRIEDGEGDVRAEKVLRDRLVALFRVDLLGRIFSEDRIEKIKQSIKNTNDNNGGLYE